MEMGVTAIAHIEKGYREKFGVPRQSGLVKVPSLVVFEKPYRNPEALRGLEAFSHLWLIWVFSEARREGWSATVRPPRLGGNTRMGVFATRSPFRPNPIGLSCVRLLEIRQEERGHVLVVEGADLMDQTPILDIKPYLPYADAHPEALGGFTDALGDDRLLVDIPEEFAKDLGEDLAAQVRLILEQDPRPRYQDDPDRVYGFSYASYDIRFQVEGRSLKVVEIRQVEEC